MVNPKRVKKFSKIFVLAFFCIITIPSIIGIISVTFACRPWVKVNSEVINKPSYVDATLNLPEYNRPEGRSYLTLPEWYIVYSTDEYAKFISNNRPSGFPYFQAIKQYWQSYVEVCRVVRGKYPFDTSHQFTLGFIGISFTAENILKGIYESTIGLFSEFTSSRVTEEEVYASKVAKEYGDFLHNTPWYFFPFREKLIGLWNETSMWGRSPIRKWERKLALTAEYGGKAIYGGFTNWGAKTTYGGADTEKIYAIAEGVSPEMQNSDLEIIREIPENKYLIRVTRFETFSKIVTLQVHNGLRFVEIAGNDEILVTLLGPRKEHYEINNSEYLFNLPILTDQNLTRVALKIKLSELPLFLDTVVNSEYIIEHIYDY